MRHFTASNTCAQGQNKSVSCVLTLEVAREHVLSKRRHVADSEGGARAGPHDNRRGLFLQDTTRQDGYRTENIGVAIASWAEGSSIERQVCVYVWSVEP